MGKFSCRRSCFDLFLFLCSKSEGENVAASSVAALFVTASTPAMFIDAATINKQLWWNHTRFPFQLHHQSVPLKNKAHSTLNFTEYTMPAIVGSNDDIFSSHQKSWFRRFQQHFRLSFDKIPMHLSQSTMAACVLARSVDLKLMWDLVCCRLGG